MIWNFIRRGISFSDVFEVVVKPTLMFYQECPRQRVHSRQATITTAALNVVGPRNLVSTAVVLGVVLGSITVEISGTQRLSIRGARACRPARVS